MKNIDLENTISKGRMVYKKQFGKLFDIILFSCLFTLLFVNLILFPLLRYFRTSNERIVLLLIIIVLSIGLAIIKWYRGARLSKIYTGLSKKENGLLIDSFIQRKNFDYVFYRKDYFQVKSKYVILWLRMELNFINRENEIYLNLNYFDAHANWPGINRAERYLKKIIAGT